MGKNCYVYCLTPVTIRIALIPTNVKNERNLRQTVAACSCLLDSIFMFFFVTGDDFVVTVTVSKVYSGGGLPLICLYGGSLSVSVDSIKYSGATSLITVSRLRRVVFVNGIIAGIYNSQLLSVYEPNQAEKTKHVNFNTVPLLSEGRDNKKKAEPLIAEVLLLQSAGSTSVCVLLLLGVPEKIT